MPGDCLMRPLGELGVLDRGRSRHRPRYAPHLYGGEYPFIQTGDIKSSGGKITTFTQTYSEAGPRRQESCRCAFDHAGA